MIALLLSISLLSAAPQWKGRDYFEKLGTTKQKATHSDYHFPFLLSVTGIVVETPFDSFSKKLLEFLKKTAITFDQKKFPFPEIVLKEGQLKAILSCTKKKCLVKLNDLLEATQMEAAPDKVEMYQKILFKRIEEWQKQRKFVGYEDRADNRPIYKDLFNSFDFFKLNYPSEHQCFTGPLWESKKCPTSPKETFFRNEIVKFDSNFLQPIWRLGNDFVYSSPDSLWVVELHVYSNHYLDSTIRIYEVKALDDKRSILVVNDIMELDELKTSGFIRALYQGKMENAVLVAQEMFIDELLQ